MLLTHPIGCRSTVSGAWTQSGVAASLHLSGRWEVMLLGRSVAILHGPGPCVRVCSSQRQGTPSARRPSCTCSCRASTTRPPASWTPGTPTRRQIRKVRRGRPGCSLGKLLMEEEVAQGGFWLSPALQGLQILAAGYPTAMDASCLLWSRVLNEGGSWASPCWAGSYRGVTSSW